MADIDALRHIFRQAALSHASDREVLLAHPEVLELSPIGVREGRTRVATVDDGAVVAFATTVMTSTAIELDDLFVHPDWMGRGIGRELVHDVVTQAQRKGAHRIEVTAGNAVVGFYAQLGFVRHGEVATRFGPAARLHLDLTGAPLPRRE